MIENIANNAKIADFIKQEIIVESILCLPHFYPKPNNLAVFQVGYKYNAITGEKSKSFNENWFVICSNYFSDPFFIDFNEIETGFPVYFAWHGAGSWTAIKIAENINDFLHHLSEIKQIEGNKTNLVNYLEIYFDLENEFWKEVYENVCEEDVWINELDVVDMTEWVKGKVIITDLGNNKIKIIHLLKAKFKISPQEALIISKQSEIVYQEGYLTHLKPKIEFLKNLGATVEFRPD